MKLCIINFADGVFIKGQKRLRESLEQIKFSGDLLFFEKLPPNCPEHNILPWGFKVYAFLEAKNRGYEEVLWIDSAGIVIRPLDKINKIIKEKGVFIFSRYNSSVGQWSSDYFLRQNKIKREESFNIPEISAFCIGINFKHSNGIAFFNEWKKMAEDGISFMGLPKPFNLKDSLTNINEIVSKDKRVFGHRQDQTAASVVAYKLNIKPNSNLIFDLIGEAKNGRSYAKYIPLDTLIIQNRDIKGNTYIKSLTCYWNNHGLNKIFHYVGILYYTLLRKIKDLIKWNLKYRFKYKK